MNVTLGRFNTTNLYAGVNSRQNIQQAATNTALSSNSCDRISFGDAKAATAAKFAPEGFKELAEVMTKKFRRRCAIFRHQTALERLTGQRAHERPTSPDYQGWSFKKGADHRIDFDPKSQEWTLKSKLESSSLIPEGTTASLEVTIKQNGAQQFEVVDGIYSFKKPDPNSESGKKSVLSHGQTSFDHQNTMHQSILQQAVDSLLKHEKSMRS